MSNITVNQIGKYGQSTLDDITDMLRNYEIEVDSLEKENEELEAKADALERDNEELKDKINELVNKINELEEEK